ncbi:hypothetical protein AB6A40_000406 [Gnathostoma spinigerum]|uniref:Uncharacterized protein n=1 Tax=Gnathostoma spinigerum TaxID=75299 RepID=A0ABD6EAJ2_9BILA
MVKLFVGGLPEGVDSVRLRQLFSQFVIVNECDVIKDYAFVHVVDEESAKIAIEKLDGYILEGKSINIRRSTSKLRKEPGMDRRCYRCGAADHKTPQCPGDPLNISLLKRPNSSGNLVSLVGSGPDAKRFATAAKDIATTYTPTITINLTGRSTEASSGLMTNQTYMYTHQQPVTQQPVQQQLPPADPDPELARPFDADLLPLYEQYMESRTKYFYFRERLSKEVKARSQAMPAIASAAPLAAPYSSGVYITQPQPTNPYLQQIPTQQAPLSAAYPAAAPQLYTPATAPYAVQQPQPARLY